MADKEKTKQDEPEKVKYKIIVRADKVQIRRPSGIVVIKYKGDVIDKPWPELLKEAQTQSGRRLFTIVKS